jgi:hypothetical protein
MLANLMVKFMEELASVTMPRPILIDLLLEVSKVTLFLLKEETTSQKYNGDSEKTTVNIMDPSIPSKETPSRKNTSFLLEIGQPKFGLKS